MKQEVGQMLLRAMMIVMLGVSGAQAQDVSAAGPGAGALAGTLPEKALKALRAAPDVFLQNAAAVIYGFGTDGGIDLAGIDTFVAAERAKVRAREMARYLPADLNNDGDISRDEMAVLADAAPAVKRGRLQRGYDLADADENARLSVVELRDYAQGVALAQMTDADAATVHGLLLFDHDGNGIVAMDEVASGVSALVDGS